MSDDAQAAQPEQQPVKRYALVRPDGVVQQTLDAAGDLGDLGDLRAVEYDGPIGIPLREVAGKIVALELSQAEADAKAWATVRSQRDHLLKISDWTQVADAPLDQAQRSAWTAYRQALRDLPSGGNLAALSWPIPPT